MKHFELLRKKRVNIAPVSSNQKEFYLQLDFDDSGNAYLQAVDAKGKQCVIEYSLASGRMRDILRAMSVIMQNQDFHIDWEGNSKNYIYLKDHDYLLEMARDTGRIKNAQGKEITFADEPGWLELVLKDEKQKKGIKHPELNWELRFQGIETAAGKEIRFLSERYVMSKDTVYEVPPIGENFHALHLFHTSISTSDLKNYLALVFSSFSGLRLRYPGYGIREGQPVQSLPAIVFEDVDAFNGLRIHITSLVEGYTPQFFMDYDISKVVDLNEMEKKLVVREVIHNNVADAVKDIRRMLLKHKKRLKNKNDNDFFHDGDIFILEKELAAAFLYSELSGLLERYILLGTEKLSAYKIKPAVKPELSLRLNHGIDFLEGDGSLHIDDQEFNLVEVLRNYRKKGFVTLNDGTNVILEKKYIDKLQRIFDVKDNGLRISFFDLPIVEDLIEDRLTSSSLPGSRDVFLGFNSINTTRPKLPAIKGKLRSYQVYCYKWLRYLNKHGLGGCLADDMGLGKTVQTITILAAVAGQSKKPSLIVMPKTLIFNWQREFEKFYPDLKIYTWYGTTRDMKEAVCADVILTTYGMVRNNIEEFRDQEFFYIILDESQNIKNARSKISRAVMLLNGEHRLALSGTPVENNLGELYSLFRFLNPAMFRTEDEFVRRYVKPIQNDNNEDAIRELRKKVYPFILRRLKKDVLPDLPDKVEQMLYVEMNLKQERLYEERRRFYRNVIKEHISTMGINKSQFFILQALMELRQIASCPESRTDGEIISAKRELLIENILDAVNNGHKVVIFANFLSAVESVSQDLADEGISALSMTGATRNRKALVDRFQNDNDTMALVMTLKTGGVGLNLTAADRIFIFDPWWNLAAENQAIDRTHRIGQKNTVFCYKLICRNTIEEKMVELQEKKRELVDAVISSDSGMVKKLTAEDVEFILS